MNWYIGQDIVCVKTHSRGVVKEGNVYTIKSLKDSECKCGGVLIHVGVSATTKNSECIKCGHFSPNNGQWWLKEFLFSPLDELANIDELNEVLETTKPFEV